MRRPSDPHGRPRLLACYTRQNIFVFLFQVEFVKGGRHGIPDNSGKGRTRRCPLDGWNATPEHANALLVIMPSQSEGETPEEWQRLFDTYFGEVRPIQKSSDLDTVGDRELNQLVHAARHK